MILTTIMFIIWLFTITLFYRYKMHFFLFITGSIGLFCFLMLIGQSTIQQLLQYTVAYSSGKLGTWTNLYQSHPAYSMITVYYKVEAISFFVDYECSGIIEMLVYISLLIFYPIYSVIAKVRLMFFGVIYIFVSNVIRVFIICFILKMLGPNLLFFSHTVIARIAFFFMMVILYYIVFTKPHILRQKVGNLSYGK